jgi:hypothetical protein
MTEARRAHPRRACWSAALVGVTTRIRQWMARLDQQGASPSLPRQALAVLNNALEYAVRYEVLPGNPAKLVPGLYTTRLDSHMQEAVKGLARELA